MTVICVYLPDEVATDNRYSLGIMKFLIVIYLTMLVTHCIAISGRVVNE